MDQANDEWPARKRLRTSHACDACRTRKTRCDGNNPCATCASIGHDCTYGSEANSRSKNDLILESVLRVEKTLHELRSAIPAGVQLANSPQTNRTNSFSGSSPDLNLRRQSHAIQTPTSQDQRENVNNFENAVLDSMHTSTTESILQWPHFDVFPLLRHDGDSIFYLEQARPPLAVASNPMYPYVDAEDITSMLEAFERNINFWYPSMSQEQLGNLRATLQTGMPSEDTVHSCLCLLTLALGCASQAAEDLRFTAEPDAAEKDRRLRKRKLGDIYFQLALKKLHVAHLQVDSGSTQCLFFTALYFASLVRPLQAWEYLSATATRCMLLLSYPPNTHDDEAEERIRRIFWSCYILESDYMAELSACPPSGIARVESSIPLPSTYHTHPSEIVEEESSLYFLACISMRRLLNRVHQLLYAKDTGAAFDHTRFPRIVAELQRQLDDWREVLPASFSFSIDTEEAATAAGGFLRQRYLTCKGVIYRPYLMWMLSSSYAETRVPPIPDAMQNCKLCLDACLLHALDLRGFPQTVLIDTWICSLSMSGAMLIILAASHVPALKEFIGSRATLVGSHLEKLFRNWREVSFGGDSPSVDRINGLVRESPFTTRIHERIQAAKAKASRDFRSDVVTVPVEEMMEAILAASVNDDIYDAEGDPSVKAL
ncbi:Zn(2)-C6 fungal-type DNA-binding domain [Fusarium oxysporum f. sp. vasinfectum]|nr:Zn(2)-C6 fungal-type DNA-binding domain [Fusarium oxysporum f. sp. vasinfectum]KAK2930814.1 Zn2-C6 fungal-type DNA-binding domain [Fusarium oxysporum f. sp. vasinfectum]